MRVAPEAVTLSWEEVTQPLPLRYELIQNVLCSVGHRPPGPKSCWSLGKENSCQAALRRLGTAGTLTSPLPRAWFPGRGCSLQGWGRHGQSLRMSGRGSLPAHASHVFAQRHHNGCRPVAALYKAVFQGISRLLNYSFASGTRSPCFPN